MSSPLLDIILQVYRHVEFTRYAHLASSSIIVYDHIVTLGPEVDLIWAAPWSNGKMLFILNRYYSLATVLLDLYGFFSAAITPSFCLRFFQWQGWTGLVAAMLAQLILQMRIYAMYSLNKAVLVFMVASFLASTLTSAWIMFTALASIETRTINVPLGKFCMADGIPQNFYTFWIPLIAFEAVLCILALIRGLDAVRTGGSLFRAGRLLVRILIRDSVLYFLVIGATYTACLLIWLAAPITLFEVPIGFSIAMSCVVANRIILNVREINRNLELSKAPTTNHRVITIPESYFCSQERSLTPLEMDQLRMMRPAAPEPYLPYLETDAESIRRAHSVL